MGPCMICWISSPSDVPRERRLPADEAEEDDAERPDVAARVGITRGDDLLGRHVARRAEEIGGLRHDAVVAWASAGIGVVVDAEVEDLGDAEVEDLDDRLAAWPSVRNRFAGLRSRWTMPCPCASAIASHAWRMYSQASEPGAGPLVEQVREVGALEVLHHHVRRAVVERADVEDARHVLALEADRVARLAEEAALVIGRADLVAHELQRDHLTELEVASGDDVAHATLAEDALDPEFPGNHVPRANTGHGRECARPAPANQEGAEARGFRRVREARFVRIPAIGYG